MYCRHPLISHATHALHLAHLAADLDAGIGQVSVLEKFAAPFPVAAGLLFAKAGEVACLLVGERAVLHVLPQERPPLGACADA
jgi:hypothetical protein